MYILKQHIALFLSAIFLVTFMPFNALHHHAEEEHYTAMVSNEKGHACELDSYFCQDEFSGTCAHTSHISTTHAKCFSCQFHFEKNYTSAGALSCPVASFQSKEAYAYLVHAATTAAKLISNKGPPVVC